MTFLGMRSPEEKWSAEKEVILTYLVLTSICSLAEGQEATMETRKEDKENKTKQNRRRDGLDSMSVEFQE